MSFTGQLLLLKAYVCASVFSILNAQKADTNFTGYCLGNGIWIGKVFRIKKGTRVVLRK